MTDAGSQGGAKVAHARSNFQADEDPVEVAAPFEDVMLFEARLNDLERRVENVRLAHDAWTVIVAVLAAVALFGSAFAVGLGLRAIDESKRERGAPQGMPALIAAAPGGPHAVQEALVVVA
jgi:hypothetical protein